MECQRELIASGRPYPRTCPSCGLAGPCKRQPKPDAEEPREWLIRKGGYFYRPNGHGYTLHKAEAGRYTKAEADREAAIEPWHMWAIHQDAIVDDPESAHVESAYVQEIAKLKAEIAALKAERQSASGLSLAQGERLDMLAEEAGEIAVAIGKIKRHGYESYHPNRVTSATNRNDLEKEIGDLIGIMRRMVSEGDLNGDVIEVAASLKWVRARPYTHHQGCDNA